jgi:putative nucleotidyltransferase with HDIG domain
VTRELGAASRRLYLIAQSLVLALAMVGAALLSRAADWHPVGLVLLLFALALLGDRLSVQVRSQHLSAAFVALVLAAVLLGPAPAVAAGLAMGVVDALVRRLPLALWLNNLTAIALFEIAGALMAWVLLGAVHHHRSRHALHSVALPLTVVAVFFVGNALNFLLIALNKRLLDGRGLLQQIRGLLIPLLPSQLAAATLAALLALAYVELDYGALVFAIVIVLAFQYLAIALVRSEDRAFELASHAQRLATLQLGVLVTLVETLQLRDPMTARHAAAVARYARGLARELGLDEHEQDHAHSAGLLHDIGKFAFPDRILHATGGLGAQERRVVCRHPQDGASLVGRLDGYGPVADTILYHHERVDGTGYPAGLIGNEIPLLSRIVAVCETFDVLTARDSYRLPLLEPADAFAELRASAGTQLDAELVERFVTMVERERAGHRAPGDEASFEAELDFERRARAIAQPV